MEALADGGGGGGTINVVTAAVAGAASSLNQVSSDVTSQAAGLVAAFAAGQGAVGDPTAAGAMGDLAQAWMIPLGALGVALQKTAAAAQQASAHYAQTDGCIASAAGGS